MAQTLRAIGTMSGTSLDGIDIALIETDGETISALGPARSTPYSDSDRALLRRALHEAVGLTERLARPGALAEAEAMLTARHGEALQEFMAGNGLGPGDIDVVGFHGQTVLHRPERRLTVQLGDGPALARLLGITVVHDLRAADVAAGGQGAPFVPAYHRALAERLGGERPVCVVNIGGVSNVTYIGAGGELLACDTGPGNALLDDFMLARTGIAIDRDGLAGARGRVDSDFIAAALRHPFFAKPLPKSLDRNDFAALALPPDISTEDGAATLTALTAHAIASVRVHLPAAPKRWIVCGGGASNPTMMAMLAEALDPAPVCRAQDVGWNADAIEAQAFAFLAVRALRGLPLTYPGTTGVPAPQTGGVVAAP